MLRLTTAQMSAGQRQVEDRFVRRLAGELAQRYDLPADAMMLDFVDQRRAEALRLGFETDQQVADFTEACLVTGDAIRIDPGFQGLMQRPMMRPETKAETMLRRWVWGHPNWRAPDVPSEGDL